MRIRKRAVPLPLHLLSPVPVDPVVQLQLPSPGSDQPHQQQHQHRHQPIMVRLPYQDHHDDDDHRRDLHQQQQQQISTTTTSSTTTTTTTSTKESYSGAIVIPENGVVRSPSTPSSHTKVVESSGDDRWCDEDKSIPLKKRRARYEMSGEVEEVETTKMMKSTTTNKKCPLPSIVEQEEDGDYDVVDDSDSLSSEDDSESKKKKKKKTKKSKKAGGAPKKAGRKKGGGIMEGSRCSRVNGRGWRCMQPTLVGYSLCEHHLGKGRLRSMASVRARARPASVERASSPPSALLSEVSEEKPDREDGDGSKAGSGGAAGCSNRRRVGAVKNRSLSSLLSQPNTPGVQLGSAMHHQIK